MDQLTEYSVPGQRIGHGSRIGSATVATPAPSAAVTDTQIRAFLQQQISAGALPAADSQTLYFVYTPPGVAVHPPVGCFPMVENWPEQGQ